MQYHNMNLFLHKNNNNLLFRILSIILLVHRDNPLFSRSSFENFPVQPNVDVKYQKQNISRAIRESAMTIVCDSFVFTK